MRRGCSAASGSSTGRRGGGLKLHVVYDPGAQRPVCFAVTPERVNDITAAQGMAIEPGATYVFDKAYYDFAFWARLDEAGCRFVTRIKRNSPARTVAGRQAMAPILEDRLARLSERLSGQRRNPFPSPVRLIRLRIDNGRELTLLTNDTTAPAEEIAALYKARWQVELFFKWIKQNLRLDRFLGSSRNAAVIQIMAALIVFLLLRLAQIATATTLGLQAIQRLVAHTAFARRPIAELFSPPKPRPPNKDPQLILAYA